jgi:hypothetical protein
MYLSNRVEASKHVLLFLDLPSSVIESVDNFKLSSRKLELAHCVFSESVRLYTRKSNRDFLNTKLFDVEKMTNEIFVSLFHLADGLKEFSPVSQIITSDFIGVLEFTRNKQLYSSGVRMIECLAEFDACARDVYDEFSLNLKGL